MKVRNEAPRSVAKGRYVMTNEATPAILGSKQSVSNIRTYYIKIIIIIIITLLIIS